MSTYRAYCLNALLLEIKICHSLEDRRETQASGTQPDPEHILEYVQTLSTISAMYNEERGLFADEYVWTPEVVPLFPEESVDLWRIQANQARMSGVPGEAGDIAWCNHSGGPLMVLKMGRQLALVPWAYAEIEISRQNQRIKEEKMRAERLAKDPVYTSFLQRMRMDPG